MHLFRTFYVQLDLKSQNSKLDNSQMLKNFLSMPEDECSTHLSDIEHMNAG